MREEENNKSRTTFCNAVLRLMEARNRIHMSRNGMKRLCLSTGIRSGEGADPVPHWPLGAI